MKGDYRSAEPLHRRALEISEKILGPEHPDTALILNNLGLLLRSKGDYDGAEPLLSRALEISEKVLGPEHPDTALSLSNLAGLLVYKGDYDRAEPLYRKALTIYEKVLGPMHPYTAISISNLACVLRDKGERGRAVDLFRYVLDIFEKEKISVQSILNSLALSHNELAFLKYVPEKRWEKAEHYYQQAIDLFSRASNPIESANAELNLQTMYSISGQKVDLERVRELTQILEEAENPNAEKGQKLLTGLT